MPDLDQNVFRTWPGVGPGEQPVGRALVDECFRLVEVNADLCEMLGYPREELLDLGLAEVTHPEDLDSDMAQVTRLLTGEIDSYQLRKRYRRRDGSEMVGRLTARVVRDAEGVIRYAVGTVEDVTDRAQDRRQLITSKRRLRMAMDAAGMVTWDFDVASECLQVSPNVEELWGVSAGELVTLESVTALVHPDDRHLVTTEAVLEDLVEGNELVADLRVRCPVGERWIHARGRIERDETGAATAILGTAMDVTAQHHAAEARLEAGRVFRRTIDASTDGFVSIDRHGHITDWNQAARHIFGWSSEEAIGHDAIDLLVPEPARRATRQRFHKRLAQGETPSRGPEEITCARRDGTTFPAELNVVVVRQSGELVMKQFVRDITARKTVEEQLTTQALTDALTGMPNRALLRDRLTGALERLERNPGIVGVLFVDLDRFKVVNDSLGHDAGDDLLQAVGNRISHVLRPADTVARFGGDEFVVVVEGLPSPDEVLAVAERVAHAIAEPLRLDTHEILPTASIGISIADTADVAPDVLLRDADLAMYRAKDQGGGHVELFDDGMRSRAVTRLEMETELRQAINQEELVVHYQPITTLQGTVTGVEALVRWPHPRRGLVRPAEFIPLAEETGLILPLGALVLRTACHQVAQWRATRAPDLRLSVNLSTRQLGDPDLLRTVDRVLDETGLEPSALCLEITETALMADATLAAATLRELRDLGVAIAVDDFGTGYSSLLYLRRFPVDILKLDRFFVNGLGPSAEDRAIIGSVIELAHSLGMRAVAEGVETADQLDHLSQLGCDLVQGYYYSPPVAPGEFVTEVGGDESVAETTASVHHSVAPPSPPSTGSTVHELLVVDDSPGDRSLLRQALSTSSQLVVGGEAADADEGIAAAARLQPDLILLDLALPGRDGLDALAEMQTAAPDARIVVISGFVSKGVADAAVAAGAMACLDKNLSHHALVDELLTLATTSPPHKRVGRRGTNMVSLASTQVHC